jgi:cobalt/nickel transport system permease protein
MTGLATTDCRGGDTHGAAGIVQRIDPRLRIILAAGFAILTVALSTLPALFAALAGAAMLAILARLPPMMTARRMAGMEGFMLVVLAFLPFTVPGQVLVEIGPLTATAAGISRAIEIVLTANAIVLACLALVGTIEPVVLGHALARLRVPDKIVQMLLFTVRYIALLDEEFARLRLAMRARAFQACGTMHTWRSFGWLFGMLLVRSFERAERILEAMKCRGFAGRYHVIDATRYGTVDLHFAVSVGFALTAIALIEWLL